MIEQLIAELEETWGFTTEELNHIRSQMASYAVCACIDSEVQQEAERICQNESD